MLNFKIGGNEPLTALKVAKLSQMKKKHHERV